MIEFHIEARSGVAPYMQLVHQVRQALRLGLLSEGDRLPKVKEVAAKVAINPNTVLKAYRQLENEGLVSPKPGVGTFVTGTLGDPGSSQREPLRVELQRWLAKARGAGLDEESIKALFLDTIRTNTGAAKGI
ncbi:GntR family transcriptional regulator [Kitasatospora acidiphila]|uniref:GntR family transcriptional regulator n=1 Tax=Kitasatospora acidiphila TaxID=2567942 RepID=A0A540W1V2_9ACTN|nr:GntR family transcriptional regulator [Kitasatospora acidiphila]TQF02996.1 GntR family transcriptional regulator [Kitasatospora acidiphila]